MGKQLPEINASVEAFIQEQKMFFVGTAGTDGRVNISPKGMDSLRVLDSSTVVWLNYTGSGNETAAHVLECNRMTLMFCAFKGKPWIVRLYGKAKAIHPRDEPWEGYYKLFPDNAGARQIFLMKVESVGTSCGFSVPLYDYVEDRTILDDWASKKELEEFWAEYNVKSIDGKPTNIFG